MSWMFYMREDTLAKTDLESFDLTSHSQVPDPNQVVILKAYMIEISKVES